MTASTTASTTASSPSERLCAALNRFAQKREALRQEEVAEYGFPLPHGSMGMDWYNDCAVNHPDFDEEATESLGLYDGTVIATDGVVIDPIGSGWGIFNYDLITHKHGG